MFAGGSGYFGYRNFPKRLGILMQADGAVKTVVFILGGRDIHDWLLYLTGTCCRTSPNIASNPSAVFFGYKKSCLCSAGFETLLQRVK